MQSKIGTGESVQDRIVRLMVRNAGSLWGRYKEQAVKELAAKVMGPARPRGGRGAGGIHAAAETQPA